MPAVDARKQSEKIYARNDASGLLARLSRLGGSVEGLSSEVGFAVAGDPSGLGDAMGLDLQQASEQLSQALQELRACHERIDRLDVSGGADDG